ncbi:hypothetical protein D3C72_644150 [compost metagenome]
MTVSEEMKGAYPQDREFFAETADETVVRLSYWLEGSLWAQEPMFSCVDEDGAAYAASDLFAWAYDEEALLASIQSSRSDGAG